MALLAEEIVEEWLNRQGYFTIRGIKVGVQEIDLLAIKQQNGTVECRHIEVQASMRPVSYISQVPKSIQKQGRASSSVKRSPDELLEGVAEWVEKKFRRPDKTALMQSLWEATWSSELVAHVVKSEEELALIARHGIKVHRLNDIIDALANASFPVSSASGADIVDLILAGAQMRPA